jgi:hypothetical protein
MPGTLAKSGGAAASDLKARAGVPQAKGRGIIDLIPSTDVENDDCVRQKAEPNSAFGGG